MGQSTFLLVAHDFREIENRVNNLRLHTVFILSIVTDFLVHGPHALQMVDPNVISGSLLMQVIRIAVRDGKPQTKEGLYMVRLKS